MEYAQKSDAEDACRLCYVEPPKDDSWILKQINGDEIKEKMFCIQCSSIQWVVHLMTHFMTRIELKYFCKGCNQMVKAQNLENKERYQASLRPQRIQRADGDEEDGDKSTVSESSYSYSS